MQQNQQNIVENLHEPFECPLCKKGSRTFFFEKNGYTLFRCSNCKHISVHPIPSKEKLDEVYAQDYFSGRTKGFGYADYDRDKEVMRPIFKHHLEIIEEKLGDEMSRSLLDVGAATGFFVGVAASCNWDARGVELSEYAASLGRKRGLNISAGTISTLNANPRSFDVITMWDLLEHLSNPRESLARAFDLLKPGGILAINTPDSGSLFAKLLGRFWHLYVPPEHLHYFNRLSLETLLRACAFEPILFSKIGKRFTLLYVIETLATWQKFKLWRYLADRIKSSPRLSTLSLPIHLRDNMFVLAKKPLL